MNTKDLEYEANNKIENTDKIKCKNYKFCNKCVEEDIKGYFCEICGEGDSVNSRLFINKYGDEYEYVVGPHGWGELEMVENSDECPICFESNNTKIKFPSGCGHSFCIDCTKHILIWEEPEIDEPSYESYGCPPCPNGCSNPPLGKQCKCDEYVKWCGWDGLPDDRICIVEKWRRTNEETRNKYYEREIEINSKIIEDLVSEENTRGNMRCPLCRSKFRSKNDRIREDIGEDGVPDRYYEFETEHVVSARIYYDYDGNPIE